MKKSIFILLFTLFTVSAFSQHDVYQKNGVAVEGYDLVAYFSGKAKMGTKTHATEHEGVTYLFTSEANKNAFTKNPEKYLPEYGGYCAYAVAKKGEKVSINPKSFLVEDDKLYLFYNSWGVNTLKKWNKEGSEPLKKLANQNWDLITKE